MSIGSPIPNTLVNPDGSPRKQTRGHYPSIKVDQVFRFCLHTTHYASYVHDVKRTLLKLKSSPTIKIAVILLNIHYFILLPVLYKTRSASNFNMTTLLALHK